MIEASIGAREVEEEVAGMTSGQTEALREHARADLYFCCKGVLDYDQLRPSTHLPLCSYMVVEDRLRRLTLMSRGHLKSTICTMGDSIRLALINPNIRILIASANATKAESFLTEIKNHWMKESSTLCQLFPELVPPKFGGPGSDWSASSASLNRDATFKESTWNTIGAGGSGTSQHFNRLKLDDIVDEQHKQSRADMERVKIWNRSSEELLDNQNTDTIDWIGTRKTVDDVYNDIMETYGEELSVFLREPIENGEVIYPLKFNMEKFKRMMQTKPEEWFHDYMNNPIGKGGKDWGEGWLKFFILTEDGNGVYYEEPHTRIMRRWKLAELDIVITVDPNSGKLFAPDKAAICVHGISPRKDIFVLSSRSDRWTPDGLVDEIWRDALRWRPRVIGIEEAGQINTDFYLKKKCVEEGISFQIVPIPHKNIEKEIRIRKALDTPIRSGRLFVQPGQAALQLQISLHPQLAVHNWDEIDALSMGPYIYREGMSIDDLEEAEEAKAKVLTMRGRTGYGQSWRRHGKSA